MSIKEEHILQAAATLVAGKLARTADCGQLLSAYDIQIDLQAAIQGVVDAAATAGMAVEIHPD